MRNDDDPQRRLSEIVSADWESVIYNIGKFIPHADEPRDEDYAGQ